MMLPIDIGKTDRILIIAPHPDDECIGCGGILILFPNQCEVIVLTDGRKGDHNRCPNEVASIRKKEFTNEMECIGIKSYLWKGYPDGELMKHLDCFSDFDFSEYDYIFIPRYDDNHPDHTAAYLCIKEQAHRITAKVYQYEVHVPFHDPDRMIDISNVIEEKIRIIQFHKSQLKHSCYADKAKALAKYRACSINNPQGYIEAFIETNFNIENDNVTELLVKEKLIAKNQMFLEVLLKWVENQIKGYYVSKYIEQKGANRVSIYGFSKLGRLLYFDLLSRGINVIQIMDNRIVHNSIGELEVISPQYGDRNSDLIIVTAIYDYESIEADLMSMGYAYIMSLQELVEMTGMASNRQR